MMSTNFNFFVSGLQRRVMEMLLSYNALWLRIGLETICGELLWSLTRDALSRFAFSRILWSADLARQFAHPNVVNFYKNGFDAALNKHILKRFLQLLFFLDQAKSRRLIEFDPCLFKKNSKHKVRSFISFCIDTVHSYAEMFNFLYKSIEEEKSEDFLRFLKLYQS